MYTAVTVLPCNCAVPCCVWTNLCTNTTALIQPVFALLVPNRLPLSPAHDVSCAPPPALLQGDFFESIPVKADCYVMKSILHDCEWVLACFLFFFALYC